ncbi:MAG: ABC transporter permease [Bacillota bacterium]
MTEKRSTLKFLSIFEWSKLSSILTPIIGILIGLALTSFVLLWQGVDPIAAFKSMFAGALGGKSELGFTLLEFIPYAFGGLAITLAYRGGMFNIGVEGQIYIAALFTTWIAISIPDAPKYIILPLSLIGGVLAAGAYAFIPAFLKAKRGMNEVLICMLMNYIGIYLVGTAVNSFLKAPNQPDPKSVMLSQEAWFAKLIPGTYLHTGFIFVFVAAILLYFVLFHTSWGYQLRSVGFNTKASKYGGIVVPRTMIVTMVISGILAGFAGSMTILGSQHRLYANFMINYGYDAVPVALLGGLNPFGVLATAFLFGVLKNGGNAMQISMGIPVSIVSIVNAIAILSIIAITQIKTLYLSKSKRGAKK